MRLGPSPHPLLAAGLAAFIPTYQIAQAWQARLVVPTVGPDVIYTQDSEDEGGGEDEGGAGQVRGQGKTFQKLNKSAAAVMADYGFTNFNQDFLTIHFQVPRAAYEDYVRSWGYDTAYLDGLKKWESQALDAAYAKAKAVHQTQAQFDQVVAQIKAQRDQKTKDYLTSKSFRFLSGKENEVEVDMPKIVRNNAPLLKAMSQAFDRVGVQRHYDSTNLIGAVASLVQTAIIYWVMPPVVGTVHNGGFWPPLQTLASGRGDCITKTAVLASVLANFGQMRMVGIALPGHYIMGVLRIPNKGDLFVEYQGLQYVLVEPAGPAWLAPGMVGDHTQVLLEAAEGYRIEPFF